MSTDQSRQVSRVSVVEALTQIRALCDEADRNRPGFAQALWPEDIRAVLDAVSVDATPPQEEERSRDEYGARPLLGVGVGDDTWPIERATPAQRLDRDALVMLIDGWGAEQPLHLADAVLALVRPVEGIVLSPEDCSRLMGAVVRGGFRTGDPADQALASRLEVS